MMSLRARVKKNEEQQRKSRVSLEGQLLDQKSLRAVTGKTANWNEIAKDCIAFANATGERGATTAGGGTGQWHDQAIGQPAPYRR